MEGKNYLLTFELVGGQKQTLPLFVPKGDKGDKGDDYVLTEADKTEIAQRVLASLPVAEGVGF